MRHGEAVLPELGVLPGSVCHRGDAQPRGHSQEDGADRGL